MKGEIGDLGKKDFENDVSEPSARQQEEEPYLHFRWMSTSQAHHSIRRPVLVLLQQPINHGLGT